MEFIREPHRLHHTDANGTVLAEIDFPAIPNQPAIAITHTFVHPDLRGQGVANQLLDAVITIAKAEGLKIKPECSFAQKVFAANPSYAEFTYHE